MDLQTLAKGWKRPRKSLRPSLNSLAIKLTRMRKAGEDVTHSPLWRQYVDLLNEKAGKDSV